MGVTDTDIMATTERDLLMKPLPLAPMLMPQPTPGMDTMAITTGLTDMVITVTDTTMARDLPMREPLLNLDPTPMLILQPTPGMDIMAIGHMAMPTGDKMWTSRTTSDLSLPTHL